MHPHIIVMGMQGGIGLFYFKKFISYIDCFENGDKVGNAGYVKVIIEDKQCTLDIHIKGWRQADNLCIPIRTPQGAVLGEIQITKGAGSYSASYSADNLDGRGTPAEKIHGLHFPITEDCYCRTVWETEDGAEKGERGKRREPIESGFIERDVIEKEDFKTEKGSPKDRIRRPDGIRAAEQERQEDKEIPPHRSNKTPLHTLYTDKWQQLCHTYQKIHPFREEDEFISIEPKDFVIMRQEYQQLVNNSFLLHGFYNYRHIILGRKQGNSQYYIGVPGTYYEREKMVAVMFGFEGFEPSGKETIGDRVEQGTYGYYMKKVNI